MSESRRAAISAPWRFGAFESVTCPTCGLDLTHAPLMDRERHAEECEAVLTQLDDEDNERDDGGDGDDELDDDLDDKLFMLVDQIDARRRNPVAAAETSKAKEEEKDDDDDVEFKVERRAIRSAEDIHDWLKRIGMERYFESLYVKEDLLDVSVARECSKEDLMSVGVSEADALVLAFCGGEPPDDAFTCDEPPPRPRMAPKPKITAPKTRSRTALELAKATAKSNSEQLWSVAKGVADRGRGESLPSIDRFRSAA